MISPFPVWKKDHFEKKKRQRNGESSSIFPCFTDASNPDLSLLVRRLTLIKTMYLMKSIINCKERKGQTRVELEERFKIKEITVGQHLSTGSPKPQILLPLAEKL